MDETFAGLSLSRNVVMSTGGLDNDVYDVQRFYFKPGENIICGSRTGLINPRNTVLDLRGILSDNTKKLLAEGPEKDRVS